MASSVTIVVQHMNFRKHKGGSLESSAIYQG